MNATDHSKLQDEYRIVLRLWSEARALYQEGSTEVREVSDKLKEMECLLTNTEPKLLTYRPL
jgi:hypothetical protein